MKTSLVEHYRCPVTGGALELHAYEQEPGAGAGAEEVKTGILVSPEGGFYYPIINHVPVLLDFGSPIYDFFERDQAGRADDWKRYRRPAGRPRPGELITQKTFTAEWNGVLDNELTFTYTAPEREQFIRMELDWAGGAVPGSFVTLDVGCGYGLETQLLARVTGRRVFGIDLNLSLLKAGGRFKDDPLVSLAVASAFAPPFARESFDLVYSHGVLHHTCSTKKAFDSILRFKKRDGQVCLWVYALEDSQRGSMKKKAGYLVELLLRPRIARLPAAFQAPVVNALAWSHFRRYRRTGLKRDTWKFSNSVHSMRDRWTPRYAHRHSFHEVISWFRERGMEYRLLDPLEYRTAFGRNLIGVAIRGWPAPAKDAV